MSVLDGATEVWGQDYFTGTGNVPLGGVLNIALPAGTVGRAVQVQFLGLNNSGNGYLHMAEVEIDGYEVGSTFCTSNANSTGAVASIRGVGIAQAGPNNFGVIAEGLPPLAFGYFLASPNPGNLTTPTSIGVLCLGGPYARFSLQTQQTADAGTAIGTGIDLTQIPLNPTIAVQPGQTLYFQYWYRDAGSTSNTSNGVAVTLE